MTTLSEWEAKVEGLKDTLSEGVIWHGVFRASPPKKYIVDDDQLLMMMIIWCLHLVSIYVSTLYFF